MVFLDPPYHKGLIVSALNALRDNGCLSSDALIVCEHGRDESLSPPVGFSVYKQKKCGEVSLTMLKNED